MKRHFRYLKILTVLAVVLGLAFAAWSGDAEVPAPNAPPESRQLTDQADSQEPNAPAENQQLNVEEESREPTGVKGFQEPAGPAYGRELPGPPVSWDAYRIVVERNMFSRQRSPRSDRVRRRVPVLPPAPDPESYVVLKGIVQQDGAFMAFLEDSQSGQIFRVRKGDSVLRGKIKSLTLDSIEYESEGRTTAVTMGLNLQGGRNDTTFTGMYELTQMSPATPAEGTTESSSPPTEDEAEILRQLMERRQQQVGQ